MRKRLLKLFAVPIFHMWAAILLVLPAVALANPSPSTNCELEYDVAWGVMELRQDHYPMPRLVENAQGIENLDNRLMAFAIIYKAYEEHVWGSPKGKENAVKRFANEVYMLCIKRGVE